MNQSSQLSKSFRDFSEKEPSKTKYGSRDYHTEAQPEDTERIGIGFPRVGSKFDYSNFGIFFKHKASNSRGSNDSYTGRAHLKKKSNDTSSSSRESTLKRLSSKDLSNLEELYENTTVITTPQETKPHSKRVSNEIPITKNMSEDGFEPWQEYLPEIYNDTKKKKLRGLSLSGTSITSKDEKHEQEILGTISKLGLNGENEEQKADMSFKDLKLPRNNFNAEVIERIKTKALHHRRTSASNNSGNNQDNYFAFLQNNEIEGRTNNNSVFNGGKKLNKGLSQNKNETYDLDLIESFTNSDSLLFRPFESEIPVVTATFGKQSQANGPVFTKESKNQELTNDLGNKKTNLSTIPTENSVDSDNIAASNFNYHNNSFSTLFSGTNNSFNNSGKIDFNSPQRIDPEKPIENLRATMTNPQLISKISIQKTLFTPNQQIGTVCEGGSGNNTDRSNSLSWNEDQNANSNFSSALSTPQGLQKQSFLNTNLNATSYSRTSQNTKNNNKFPTSNQDLIKSVSKGVSNTDNADYNPKGPMKQNKPKPNNRLEQDQKDNSFFVVDVNKIEADTRTTLMVKNIPNKYDLPLLLQTVEKNHKGKFDFLYLPIDPRNKCNVGYAFINFIDTRYVKDFFNEFNGKKWEKFNSEKVCDIKYGRIQGKKALIHHFQYSNVMSQQDQKLKPHIPAEFEPINNKKIKDLVNKQKLQSGGDNL